MKKGLIIMAAALMMLSLSNELDAQYGRPYRGGNANYTKISKALNNLRSAERARNPRLGQLYLRRAVNDLRTVRFRSQQKNNSVRNALNYILSAQRTRSRGRYISSVRNAISNLQSIRRQPVRPPVNRTGIRMAINKLNRALSVQNVRSRLGYLNNAENELRRVRLRNSREMRILRLAQDSIRRAKNISRNSVNYNNQNFKRRAQRNLDRAQQSLRNNQLAMALNYINKAQRNIRKAQGDMGRVSNERRNSNRLINQALKDLRMID